MSACRKRRMNKTELSHKKMKAIKKSGTFHTFNKMRTEELSAVTSQQILKRFCTKKLSERMEAQTFPVNFTKRTIK